MRTQIGLCAVALILAAFVSSLVLAFPPAGSSGESLKRSDVETGLPEPLLTSIRHRLRGMGVKESAREERLVRVTRDPFPVNLQVAMLCRASSPVSPHDGHWIHVYVTSRGYDTMKTGKGVYPRGTVILKEKFADAAGTKPVLFTGMLKREKGYDPTAGDWQFFVLNADATAVDTRDRHSCARCHVPFRDTDYVARTYLKGTDVARSR
jgi:Cytochrome P460